MTLTAAALPTAAQGPSTSNASLIASCAAIPANANCTTARRISVPIPRLRWPGANHENVVTVPNVARRHRRRGAHPLTAALVTQVS
jgi:hypothetical protein